MNIYDTPDTILFYIIFRHRMGIRTIHFYYYCVIIIINFVEKLFFYSLGFEKVLVQKIKKKDLILFLIKLHCTFTHMYVHTHIG